MKLVQKNYLKGSKEFEIIDNAVYVRIKGLLKEEKSAVPLILLNPEPVVNGNYLEFFNPDNTELQLSLYLNKPSASEFNAFVDLLKQRIPAPPIEHKSDSQPKMPAGTTNEEPPEFEEYDPSKVKNQGQSIKVADIDIALEMLTKYMDTQDISALLSALQTLKTEPQNESYQAQVVTAFNELGVLQGAVLTYAPYLNVFVSDDPFAD